MAAAIDVIAERIRALGEFSPGTFKQFTELSKVTGQTEVPNANNMLKELVANHETLVTSLKNLSEVASDLSDKASEDLGIRRTEEHQNYIWMLQSSAE